MLHSLILFIYYKTFEPEIVWFHWLCFVDLKNAKVEHYNLKIFSLEVFFFFPPQKPIRTFH